IEGYSPKDSGYVEEDTSNYTYRRFLMSAMGSDIEYVISYDFEKDDADGKLSKFRADLVAAMYDIDTAISTAVTNSDINKFNAAGAGDRIEISQTMYEVLKLALRLYEETDGYYNPAVYYSIYAYRFGLMQYYPTKASELPNDEDIAKYTELASHFGDLTIDKNDNKYYATKPEYTVEVGGEVLAMKIDLGGIGKGYAVDKVEEVFNDCGFHYGYFNLGASSMLMRGHPTEGSWYMFLKNPRGISDENYLKIPARNEKLSTSGDNMKFYIIDGTRYCHVIDPTTGKPIQTGIMSATIIGGSAAEDDAYTTAIMAMGKDKAVEFIKTRLTDRKVVFTCV
ncbi:MAG: FAD:protein FMN transferase, partial [Clostridia bacterium]|nr:FAD:protein FMN transferase [Clostridia bacterium]